MLIEEIGKRFEIIYIKRPTPDYEVMYCKDSGNLDNENSIMEWQYTILHILKYELVLELLPIFQELGTNKLFKDYQGCFSRDEDVYAIFKKRYHPSIEDVLGQEHTIEQRLSMGKKILEKIIYFDPPDFMICHMLQTNQIAVCREEIFFSYDWEMLWTENQTDIAMINLRMAELLELLFVDEIKNRVCTKLEDFLNDLKEGKLVDFFSIYEAYRNLYHVLLEDACAYDPAEHTLFYKVSQKAKKAENIIQVFIFLFVYAVTIAVIVYTFTNQEIEEAGGILFERIGNLSIK